MLNYRIKILQTKGSSFEFVQYETDYQIGKNTISLVHTINIYS